MCIRDSDKTVEAYKCQCYPKELSLEGEEGENNFLETAIVNTGKDIKCKHRNKNAGMTTQEFYRGKHAWSYNDERHKMGAMIGTFTRIQRNSSTDELAMLSMMEKIQELQTLQYTHAQCAKAIRYLANKHNTQPLWSKCFHKITGITLDGSANDAYHLNP